MFDYPEEDPDEDPEEDSSEADTEIVPSEDDPPEPEDVPYGSTEVPSPAMMRVDEHHYILGRYIDQLTEAQARVTELMDETRVGDLMARMADMHARVAALTEELEAELGAPTPERAPTPPPVPVSPAPTETDDGMDPILDGVAAAPADPPPLPPLPVVSLAHHDWAIGRYHTDLAVAEARYAVVRDQLSIERHMRIRARSRRGHPSARRVRRAIRRIERRTIGRIYHLSPQRDLVSRRDVIRTVARAMRRAQDATRGSRRW